MLYSELQSVQSGSIFPTFCTKLLLPFSVLNMKAANSFETWVYLCPDYTASPIRTHYLSYALISNSQLFWLESVTIDLFFL